MCICRGQPLGRDIRERERRFVLLVFVPGSSVCFRLDGSSTTPNTVIEIGTSTWSASKRPGVRPMRVSSDLRSCCLHVWNYAGFRVSRHSSFSVFPCGVTEIVVFYHGVVTS
jgi:hypothetical protein